MSATRSMASSVVAMDRSRGVSPYLIRQRVTHAQQCHNNRVAKSVSRGLQQVESWFHAVPSYKPKFPTISSEPQHAFKGNGTFIFGASLRNTAETNIECHPPGCVLGTEIKTRVTSGCVHWSVLEDSENGVLVLSYYSHILSNKG